MYLITTLKTSMFIYKNKVKRVFLCFTCTQIISSLKILMIRKTIFFFQTQLKIKFNPDPIKESFKIVFYFNFNDRYFILNDCKFKNYRNF